MFVSRQRSQSPKFALEVGIWEAKQAQGSNTLGGGAYELVHRVAATFCRLPAFQTTRDFREKDKLLLRARPAEREPLLRLGYFVWLVLVFTRPLCWCVEQYAECLCFFWASHKNLSVSLGASISTVYYVILCCAWRTFVSPFVSTV